jgi:uncharacterized surface protein with fasciclin (FAS1) repeats
LVVARRGEKKLLLKNEGRILSSALVMRKRRTRGCGAKPTRESSCAATPYSTQAHRASELPAVSAENFKNHSFQEPSMKKLMIAVGVSVLLGACAGGMGGSSGGMSSTNPMVGGAAMYPTKDIVDNAVNSKDHTTLVAAVKAADLVGTLKSPGPFTVFAPTNAAFSALPAGTVDTLLKPENKPTLTKVLTYHVVPGRMDGPALMSAINAGGGKATLKTASGGTLTATMSGSNVMVTDAKGGTAMVTIANVYQSNGVIHVVNKVLLPG